jgi:hypothetical protein
MTTPPTAKSDFAIQVVKSEGTSKILICLPDKCVKQTIQALWTASIPGIIWILAQSPLLLTALPITPKCVPPPAVTHVQPDRLSDQN